MIEEFGDVMELIVKRLDGSLANLAGYRGSALLGDGKVLLVLDARELVT